MRTGEIEFEFSTVVVLTLIVFFSISAGGFVDQLQDILNRGFANMDKVRIDNSIESLHGEASARVRLTLHNEYNFTAGSSNAIWMDADFMNRRNGLGIQLVPWYIPGRQPGVSGDLETDELCIIKQGYSITIAGPGNCQPTACGGTAYGKCSTFEPYARSQDAQTSASGSTSTGGGSWYSFDQNVPADGFICKNGAYTEEDFYTKYRTSGGPGCEPKSGSFIDINRISCPNQALLNKEFGCVVRTTVRCPAGGKINVSVSHAGLTEDPADMVVTSQETQEALDGDDDPGQLAPAAILADTSDIIRRCSGEAQFERVPFTFNITDATRRYDLEFTVSTPAGSETRSDQAMRVLP